MLAQLAKAWLLVLLLAAPLRAADTIVFQLDEDGDLKAAAEELALQFEAQDQVLEVVTPQSSIDGLVRVARGEAQFGVVRLDTLHFLLGNPEFKKRLGDVQLVAPLYPDELILVGQNEIREVADLKGRRVNIGTEGSGIAGCAVLVLNAFGLGDGYQARESKPDEAFQALVGEQVEAVFLSTSQANRLLGDRDHGGLRLLSLGEEMVQMLSRNELVKGIYHPAVLALEEYPWLPRAAVTIATPLVLVVHKGVSNEVVATVAAALGESSATWADENPRWKSFDASKALTWLESAPLQAHPGALEGLKGR